MGIFRVLLLSSSFINKAVISIFVHKDFYIYLGIFIQYSFPEVKLLGEKTWAFFKIHTAELLSKIVLLIYQPLLSKGKEIRKPRKQTCTSVFSCTVYNQWSKVPSFSHTIRFSNKWVLCSKWSPFHLERKKGWGTL